MMWLINYDGWDVFVSKWRLVSVRLRCSRQRRLIWWCPLSTQDWCLCRKNGTDERPKERFNRWTSELWSLCRENGLCNRWTSEKGVCVGITVCATFERCAQMNVWKECVAIAGRLSSHLHRSLVDTIQRDTRAGSIAGLPFIIPIKQEQQHVYVPAFSSYLIRSIVSCPSLSSLISRILRYKIGYLCGRDILNSPVLRATHLFQLENPR